MIALNLIRIDGGTQSRIELNQDVVAEYAEAYKAGAQMPPVVVFYDGASYWLADGFHRVFGAKHAGLVEIHEDRHPGTQREAVLYSLGANSKHGLRRSNADKRKAVQTLLADPEWATWSGEAIAKVCAVSAMTVSRIRAESAISNNVRDVHPVIDHKTEPVTVSRNGTTYQQNTANIGTRPAQTRQDASSPVTTDSRPKVIAPAPADSEQPAQTELEELKDFCAEQGQNLKATLEENESMSRVFDAEDKIVAAMAEVKRFSERNRVLNERIIGLMNELAEVKRYLKSATARAEKAEAALKEAVNAA